MSKKKASDQEFGIGSTAKLDATFGNRASETATVSAIKPQGEGDSRVLYDLVLEDASTFPNARYDAENDVFTKKVG